MKYGIIKNLISENLKNQMIDLMDFLKDHNMHIYDNDKIVDKIVGIRVPAYYDIFNSVHLNILPKIENVFNLELVPTHNYSRIYQDGSILKKHIDRPSCEYSITINLYQEKGIWPIWMKDENGFNELYLEPGDAAYYKGCEVIHWREKNTKGIGYQTFMHFVEKNGKYADYIYDNNPHKWLKNLNNPMYQIEF
jgi:hypothetical protein